MLEAGPNTDAGREGGRVGGREAETGEEKLYIVLGLGFYFSFGFVWFCSFFLKKKKKDV